MNYGDVLSKSIPRTEASAYKSLLYWRKSAVNRAACVPIILTLENDILSMKDSKDDVIFQANIAEISGQFTKWGTMVIKIRNKRYTITGIPTKTSPAITDAQRAELSGLTNDSKSKNIIDSKPVAMSSAATDGVGGTAQTITKVATSTVAYYRSLATISEWKALIGNKSNWQMSLNTVTFSIVGGILAILSIVMLRR
jgi:hypothetical protein